MPRTSHRAGEHVDGAVIGKISTPSACASSPSQRQRLPRLDDDGVFVRICGGIMKLGSGISPLAVSQRKVSLVPRDRRAPVAPAGDSSSMPTGS